jgi:hypothetical protein
MRQLHRRRTPRPATRQADATPHQPLQIPRGRPLHRQTALLPCAGRSISRGSSRAHREEVLGEGTPEGKKQRIAGLCDGLAGVQAELQLPTRRLVEAIVVAGVALEPAKQLFGGSDQCRQSLLFRLGLLENRTSRWLGRLRSLAWFVPRFDVENSWTVALSARTSVAHPTSATPSSTIHGLPRARHGEHQAAEPEVDLGRATCSCPTTYLPPPDLSMPTSRTHRMSAQKARRPYHHEAFTLVAPGPATPCFFSLPGLPGTKIPQDMVAESRDSTVAPNPSNPGAARCRLPGVRGVGQGRHRRHHRRGRVPLRWESGLAL